MKANRFLGFIASVAVLAFTAAACEEEKEDLGAPSVELDKSEISLEQAGGAATVELTATRDWKATTEQDWISINPKSGDASSKAVTVEVTVLENTGLYREGAVKFDIGFDSKTLTVKQKGTGFAEDLIVYKNDFDKEEAQKTYGTGTSWPYLDQFEGWKNATGTGAGSEAYSFNAMSVRANSTSNSTYSDYEGSGSNNLFFGASAYFAVTGIKLPSGTDYSLTFGTEKYSQDNGSLFKHSEFHVYVSNDGKKWVELGYSFPNGDKEGRWDLATSNFTVPSGTTTLGIYVKADVASSYRIDDLCLSVSEAAGTVIDFSQGVDLEAGGDNPGSDYSKAESKTVKDFIAAANTSTYYKLKGKVSRFNSQYCSFDLTDETGSIYVYSVDDATKAAYSSKIKDGGTVELAGLYKNYNGTDEVVSAHVLSYSDGEDTPATEMTIPQVLSAPVGTAAIVSGTVAATYQRGFIITDGTNYLLVYDGTKCAAKEKDKVKVSGTTSEYGGLIQLASPEVTVVSSGNALTLPAPKVLDAAAFDAYSSSKIEYISYEGTLSTSGNYCNVAVAGASQLTGSLAYINDSFNVKSFANSVVKVTGFFVGVSGSSTKYLNTMVTDLVPGDSDYLSVSTTAISVAADATTASFDVKANVKWTVTSDNAAYTVDPASGDKSATVAVKFAANSDETDKVVRLTVSTTAEVATKSYTVTLTHKGKNSSSGSEVTLVIADDNGWTEASDATYGKGYEYTKDGIKYGYYKYKSTSNAVAPSSDHIRIYKSSVFVIAPPEGQKVEKVVLKCVSGKCANMTVLSDNTIAVSDVKDNTVTWTGSVDKFAAVADVSQIRATSITVVLK